MVELTVSECRDWASHSRTRGVIVVGVAAEEKDRAVEFIVAVDVRLRFRGGGTEEDEEEDVGMNEERRFWADDLRRIVGRGGSVEKADILEI